MSLGHLTFLYFYRRWTFTPFFRVDNFPPPQHHPSKISNNLKMLNVISNYVLLNNTISNVFGYFPKSYPDIPLFHFANLNYIYLFLYTLYYVFYAYIYIYLYILVNMYFSFLLNVFFFFFLLTKYESICMNTCKICKYATYKHFCISVTCVILKREFVSNQTLKYYAAS